MSHEHRRMRTIARIGVGIVMVLALGYGGYRYYRLHRAYVAREVTLAELRSRIQELTGNLSLTEYERDRLTNVLAQTEQKADTLAEEKTELAGTVDTLQKLTTIDPELLKKYSKVYFLNEHYTPSSLTSIDPQYISGTGRTLQILTEVWPRLESLLADSTKAGAALRIQSAYRSFGTQASLKAAYKVTYGTSAANRFSADQGYSEHQLGTTVDFSTAKSSVLSTAFEKTPEFRWLTEHAHEYGFVLSYPKNNKYYIYEPWHWRYVGVPLATKLHEDETYLYDVDQRDIDQYLITIFD